MNLSFLGARIALIGWLALALSACSPWHWKEDSGPFQEASLEELLVRISNRTAGVDGLSALMEMRLFGAQTVMGSLVWMRPHQLDFRAFDPLGRTLAEVALSDGEVEWRVPGRPPVLLGPLELLEKPESSLPETGLPFTVPEMVRIAEALIGPVKTDGLVSTLEAEGRFYYIIQSKTDGRKTVRVARWVIDRRGLRPVRQEFFGSGGEVVLILKFEDYRSIPKGGQSADWPHRVVIQRGGGGSSVRLDFKEVRFYPAAVLKEPERAGERVQ